MKIDEAKVLVTFNDCGNYWRLAMVPIPLAFIWCGTIKQRPVWRSQLPRFTSLSMVSMTRKMCILFPNISRKSDLTFTGMNMSELYETCCKCFRLFCDIRTYETNWISPGFDIQQTDRLICWVSFAYTEKTGVYLSVYYHSSLEYPWLEKNPWTWAPFRAVRSFQKLPYAYRLSILSGVYLCVFDSFVCQYICRYGIKTLPFFFL